MRIEFATYGITNNSNKYNNSVEYKNFQQPSFCGLHSHKLKFKDIFQIRKTHYINELVGIKAGEYGTTCKGSRPLSNFFGQFKSKREIEGVKKLGISTNDAGCAYSFLKSKADRPLSTSFVHDCSVMYLYNERKNTHFLYHIHKDEKEEEILAIINLFMPEGYSHASIVPGDKYWADTHRIYLPEIFSAIKKGSDNVKVSVYHNSSERPEVVGYKGKMYEIPNRFYSKSYIKRILQGDRGQATFSIRDFRIYTTLYNANSSNSISDLQKKMYEIKHSSQYTPELRQILYKIINERIDSLQELGNIKTKNEFEQFIKQKGPDYMFGYPQTGKTGFYSAIKNKKKELGII